MLKIINTFGQIPQNIDVDSESEFHPGQIGSLKIVNDKVAVGISDGLHPYGIIDDIRSRYQRCISWNEEIIIDISITNNVALKHSNIIDKSFTSNIPVQLDPLNGIIIVPKLTASNYFGNIKIISNYAYKIANMLRDDSTIGSGKVTIWTERMTCQTDCFDTSAYYDISNNLYVTDGCLTTTCLTPYNKCVGEVLAPPTKENPFLSFLWFGSK